MTYAVEYRGLKMAIDGTNLTISLDGNNLTENAPLFMLACEDTDETAQQLWKLESSAQNDDLLSLTYACGRISARVDLLKLDAGIRMSYTLSAHWDEAPACVWMWLPWLQQMRLGDAVMRYPANPVPKSDGTGVMQTHPAFALPFFLADESGRGISVRFDEAAGGLTWDQLRNQDMNRIDSRHALENKRMLLRLHEIPELVCEALITPLTDGWCEAFENLRENTRRNMDLTQYGREDLKWIDEAPLQHFTYAYGKEAFRYGDGLREGYFDAERLLDAGNEFGGYDSLILWHQYPRLGLDDRSQWDFFDDFPGGLSALAEFVKHAHARGTKVILPFKPWDRSPDDTDKDTTNAICRIIAETDADGIFFDTMNTVPAAFRDAVDAVKPGVVFIDEGEPQDRRSIEKVTSSWDQYWHSMAMPESNLLRFLFPEHRRHAISRWHIGKQKDTDIQRAVFQGNGMVIWQDIFGEWLPYTSAQKSQIHFWKDLYSEYADVFRSAHCVPLIPARQDGIYVNVFPGTEKGILTIYNDTGKAIEGPLVSMRQLPRSMRAYTRAEDRFANMPFHIESGELMGCIAPGICSVVVLLEKR